MTETKKSSNRGRWIWTAVTVLVYGVAMDIWLRVYPQLQGIAGANLINEDSVLNNAWLRYFREYDLVSLIVTITLLVVLFFIWRLPLKRVFNSNSEN